MSQEFKGVLDPNYKELLIGCGNSKSKQFNDRTWHFLVTLDIDPNCSPDILHDLDSIPYPFKDEEFNEIHAYEVLEHCGRQGDWKYFFAQFSEFWRILKPGGIFYATVPHEKSIWAWGDPGHTRIINEGTLVFLSQKEYEKQIGKTAITDYRHIYKADFNIELAQSVGNEKFIFALTAKKEMSNGQNFPIS